MPGHIEAMKAAVSCDKLGERHTRIDPKMAEWGNPAGREFGHRASGANLGN